MNGATSMLAVATIEECLRNGIEVVAIARRNSENFYRLPKSPNLQVIECNLEELASFTPNFNDADVFYHFAWLATTREGRLNVDVQELNIRYTIDAVRLAKRCGCHKFILAGSQAEYGLTNKPLSRTTPINPCMAYGVAKYAAGKMAEILCPALGMSFVWSRVVSTYGINDSPGNLVNYVINCYKNNSQPVLTKCEQIWDYLYVADTGRAFRLLGQCATNGVYVVGSGKGVPLKSYVETIYRLMKPSVPLVFGGKPYSENQVMHLVADISDLKRDTGFEPRISFEEGISQMIGDYAKCLRMSLPKKRQS